MRSSVRHQGKTPVPPGPRKRELKSRPRKPSGSWHKKRSIWFRARSAWPFREALIDRLVAERNRVRQNLPAPKKAPRWRCIGPTNVGGRITSIVCHPDNADHIWVGAAAGGVWKSDDAGRTWRSLWKKQESLNVGSLAI